ncbi:hypothetical protein [Porphyrobacter sp. YT40]|uniref:hypothetical protein n=1 Tax=Porphyrobacter sp. YT40 TaxID=2547601 RepID=UPI001142E777|nr:hypothetical protein [Porphyrobacter sp. YT40]QDH35581.1 hypothetical protein E2E27_15430 [Porphyrobacter sp. YT40]
MTRRPARLLAATCLLAAAAAAPLIAQDQSPGTFTLPPPTPTPTPAPAGPADERSGVAIPPRPAPSPLPSAAPSPAPTIRPIFDPPAERPADAVREPAPQAVPPRTGTPAPAPSPVPLPTGGAPSAPEPTATNADTAPAPGFSIPGPALPDSPVELPPTTDVVTGPSVLPDWWPLAAGGLGALALLGGGLLWWRRRKPAARRLAPPPATGDADVAGDADEAEQPRLDLTLEIVGATRSLMMFTLQYRLTIANRSPRAVNDLALALQLACARANAANAPSPGAAQGLERIARIGPHQARSVTGTVQLPLSAISPVRQGTTPMFVPLAHVTLEGEGLRAMSRSFVIGPRSASGRLHPILLDQPPGGIAGLVAQVIAIPPATAAA